MNEQEIRREVIDQVSKLIEERFDARINDLQLFARIFYASILSNYVRARSFAGNVGMILPELEAITKALYAMSTKRSAKQGSFETAKAFEVASSLNLTYKVPTTVKNNILKYVLTFTINHPVLLALEKGDVSWEKLEKNKIIKILESALRTLPSARNRRWRRSKALSSVEKVILKAIADIKGGKFKIKNNPRRYFEITVKNLVKQKDFINILIK